jgi:XTP/dITP diphosphohydrolase
MMKLLLASNNSGKLLEIQAILNDLDLELVLPASMGLSLEVVENGQTYQENAALKALAFAKASGLLSLADDSGLEVDILEGLPGLHSARFSPLPRASDADRRSYLLQRLAGLPPPWSARFRCTVALATPGLARADQQIWFAEANCPGEIIAEERGNNGFGYDPIFYFPHLGKTMAELTLEEKNRLSHRALAVQAIRPVLLEQLHLTQSSSE